MFSLVHRHKGMDIFMCGLHCLYQINTFSISSPYLFRGCLFYGPPGTGKTLVARALANECSHGDRKVSFFMRKGADCLSKWVGESERQLRLLFDQVRDIESAHQWGCRQFLDNILVTTASVTWPELTSLCNYVAIYCNLILSYCFTFFFCNEHHPLVLCLLLVRLTWWGHPLFSLMRLMDWLLFAPAGKTRYTGKTNLIAIRLMFSLAVINFNSSLFYNFVICL